MNSTSLAELPVEIFHNGIFRYIDDIDIFNLGKTGSQRLKEIAEDFVQIGKFPDFVRFAFEKFLFGGLCHVNLMHIKLVPLLIFLSI